MKKVVISASHLPASKNQAYQLYDAINNIDTIYLDGKSRFLNQWAECLGYDDWNCFQHATKSDHKDCTNNLIITPCTYPHLAERLRLVLGHGDLDEELCGALLAEVMLTEERALFKGHDLLDLPPAPEVINIIFGPETVEQRALLFYLWPICQSSKEGLIDGYVRYTKNQRKNMSMEEAKAKGF